MAGTWLFGKSWWKFMKALLLCEKFHVSLFFSLTGRTETVNAQGSDKDWYLASWNKYPDTNLCHL